MDVSLKINNSLTNRAEALKRVLILKKQDLFNAPILTGDRHLHSRLRNRYHISTILKVPKK